MVTVIDDTDPNLYWGNGNVQINWSSGNDRLDKTFMRADFMEIRWNGGDIAVYGARRWNHVRAAPSCLHGFADPDTFQQVLYATSGLAQGDHMLRLTNENGRNPAESASRVWLDVDFIAFDGSVRNAIPGAPQPTTAQSAPAPSSAASAPPPQSSSTPVSTPPRPSPSSAAVASSSSSTSTSLSSSISSSSAISSSASSASSASASVSSASTNSGGQFSASVSLLLPSSFQSASVSVSPGSVSISSTTTVTIKTSGQPSTPSGTSGPDSEGAASGTNKTTVVAISSTVIVLAVLIIGTVVGLWWHRRRKRRREAEEPDMYETGNPYDRPNSSWARM
ncbi:uncharacterized protein MKK02DRAFT_44790 [Dioszegia hungarica]|uniref:Uncharacterized protein n=1 Tax=Dioszegia hungarica TaxID=4972 RepID=A0AA38LVX8_9TREE|nr:uncharacterized protein MKK02DRAFT_44790 [Dioszegia hungarica]KAI9636089.1 hypothetical protein MKK02DRAFT_44790 [Dioszegia hungarica]